MLNKSLTIDLSLDLILYISWDIWPFFAAKDACTAANCCGVHIHVGSDCTDASSVGGYWWNSAALEADPWQSVMQLGVGWKQGTLRV